VIGGSNGAPAPRPNQVRPVRGAVGACPIWVMGRGMQHGAVAQSRRRRTPRPDTPRSLIPGAR